MYKIYFTILLFFLNSICYSQIKNRSYYNELFKTIGFAYGVEKSCDYIINNYPSLSKKGTLSYLNFRNAHGKSVESIESELISYLQYDKKYFYFVIDSIISNELNFSTKVKLEDAEKYLKTFDLEIIKGNNEVYKDFVKILIRNNPEYINNPVLEFTDGFKNKYSSSNNIKAKGLEISIDLPLSWSNQEGKRPNIVQLFKSYNNKCISTILIKDYFNEGGKYKFEELSKEEKEYLNSEEYIKIALGQFNSNNNEKSASELLGIKNVINTDISFTKIDGQTSIWAKGSGIITQDNISVNVHSLTYITIYNQYMIHLNFLISDINNDLEESILLYTPLCQLIKNSIVIDSKWKRIISKTKLNQSINISNLNIYFLKKKKELIEKQNRKLLKKPNYLLS